MLTLFVVLTIVLSIKYLQVFLKNLNQMKRMMNQKQQSPLDFKNIWNKILKKCFELKMKTKEYLRISQQK